MRKERLYIPRKVVVLFCKSVFFQVAAQVGVCLLCKRGTQGCMTIWSRDVGWGRRGGLAGLGGHCAVTRPVSWFPRSVQDDWSVVRPAGPLVGNGWALLVYVAPSFT